MRVDCASALATSLDGLAEALLRTAAGGLDRPNSLDRETVKDACAAMSQVLAKPGAERVPAKD